MLKSNLGNKAFSLVELIVAVIILSVGMVAVLQAFSMCARLSGSSGDVTRALFLAQDKLEELERSEGLLSGLPNNAEGSQDKFSWSYYLLLDEPLNLYKAGLEIGWVRRNSQEKLEYLTYLR